MIVSNKGGGDFDPVPAGTKPGRAIQVIDLGTQRWTNSFGQQVKRKLRIGFELPNERRVFDEAKGEEPVVIGIEFTASLNNKANLKKFLEGWRGRPFTDEELEGFDVSKLLGVPALLNVIHEKDRSGEKTYANIATAMPLPKEMKSSIPTVNVLPLVRFDLDPENFDRSVYESLPEWLRKKISMSDEFKLMTGGNTDGMDQRHEPRGAVSEPDDDEIPF